MGHEKLNFQSFGPLVSSQSMLKEPQKNKSLLPSERV